MAPGSMKEALKALDNAFGAPTVPSPLPDELCATIQSFLDRYDKIDEHDSQRFHEDLHALYQRHVAEDSAKHGAFLSALRLVRPALTGEARLIVWWNLVLKPTIDGIGHKRLEIEDAREIVQSILVYDAEEDETGEQARLSKLFTKKILDAYISRTDVSASPENVVSPENEFIANELESILITFGRKMPKLLLSALDELFVQKQYRMQALGLMSAFVRLQPPHLHLVLETSLLQHLEKCLLIDTSTIVIELALVVLIMLLPHISGALTSDHHLQKLFLVYTRVLCFDKLSKSENQNTEREDNEKDYEDSDEEDEVDVESEQAWEQLQPAEGEEGGSPTLMHYFTFLYGLFPLNFMSFIRKPRKYLKSLNFPGARDFDLDQDLIYSRTEPYRTVHLMHPNMFTTTIEEELSENRWLKSDPADVVTECMDLCVAVSAALEDPGPPSTTGLPPVPPLPEIPAEFALDESGNDSNVSWRNTQSTMFVAPGDAADVPETAELPLRSKSIASATSFKSASPLLKTHDVMDSPTLPPAKESLKQNLLGAPSLRRVNPQPSIDSFVRSAAGTISPPHPHNDFHAQTMSSLQREIMLLRNDLNFERYLKLQHLSHIGQLQRKHIREAAAEADTQNLINTNKTLKARLTKANELYAQLKKETLTSRNQSKKWESDLNAKVRGYRDSEKTWHSEEESLRFDLQRTQSDYEHLQKVVEKAEAEQLRAEQRTRALEYELEDYSNVRHELETAQQKVMEYEDQAQDLHSLIQERNDLSNELEIAHMRLNSRDAEREHSIAAYERRIMTLEQRLQSTERSAGPPGQLPASVQQMLDSGLAASQAKLQTLKKTYQNLSAQHTELQMKYQDLEAEHQAALGRFEVHERTGHFEYTQSQLSRNSSLREGSHYSSRGLPPLSTGPSIAEEREYFSDLHSPNSMGSPSSTISPAAQRPVRLDSMPRNGSQRAQRSPPGPSMYPAFGGALHPDLYEPQALARSGAAVQSSAKSSFSVDTDGSGGKDKVEPKSEVRVYGRGGAQNIGKKVKEKEQKKAPSTKTGGFRGLRGIM